MRKGSSVSHQPCILNFCIKNITLIGVPIVTSYLIGLYFSQAKKKYRTPIIHGTMDQHFYTGQEQNRIFYSKQIQSENKLELSLIRLNQFKLQQVMAKTILDIVQAPKNGSQSQKSIYFYSQNRMKIAELVYTLQCNVDHMLEIDSSRLLSCIFQSKNQSQNQKKSQKNRLNYQKQAQKLQTEEDCRYKHFSESQYQSSAGQNIMMKQLENINKVKEEEEKAKELGNLYKLNKVKNQQNQHSNAHLQNKTKSKQRPDIIRQLKQQKKLQISPNKGQGSLSKGSQASCLSRWFKKKFNKNSAFQQKQNAPKQIISQIAMLKQLKEGVQIVQLKIIRLKLDNFSREQIKQCAFTPQNIKMYYVDDPNNKQQKFAQVILKQIQDSNNQSFQLQYIFKDLKLKFQKKNIIQIKLFLKKVKIAEKVQSIQKGINLIGPNFKKQESQFIVQGIMVEEDLNKSTQNQITLFDSQGQKFAKIIIKIMPQMMQFSMQSLPYLEQNPQIQQDIINIDNVGTSVKAMSTYDKVQAKQVIQNQRLNQTKISRNRKIRKSKYSFQNTDSQRQQQQHNLSPKSKKFAQDNYNLKFNQISSTSFKIGSISQPRQCKDVKNETCSPLLMRSNTYDIPSTSIMLDENLLTQKNHYSPERLETASTIKPNGRQFKKQLISNVVTCSISPNFKSKSIKLNSGLDSKQNQDSYTSNQVSTFNVFGQENLSSTSTFAKNRGNTSNFKQMINNQRTSPQSKQEKGIKNLFNLSLRSLNVILYQNNSQSAQKGRYLKLVGSDRQEYETSILTKSLIWNTQQYLFIGMSLKDSIQIYLYEYTKDYSKQKQNNVIGAIKIQMTTLMKALKVKYYRGDIVNLGGQIIATVVIYFSLNVDVSLYTNAQIYQNKPIKNKSNNRTRLRLQSQDLYNYFDDKLNSSSVKYEEPIIPKNKKKNKSIRQKKQNLNELKIKKKKNTNGSFLPQIHNRQRNMSWNAKDINKVEEHMYKYQYQPYHGGKNIKIGKQERFNTLNAAQLRDF